MKIFITGCTGYIGQRLTTRLLTEGHEIHALSRNRPDFPSFNTPSFHFYQGDLQDVSIIAKAMEGCEAVYHVAALAKVWSKEVQDFYTVNVEGTINILEAAISS